MNTSLWTIVDVAAFLQVSAESAARMSSREGFPAPIVLPSKGKGERKIRRWLPSDISDWALAQRAAA